MSERDRELKRYHELCYYTLAHPDPAFIHQYAVDAFAAQHADHATKPITLTFALIGLYLHLEKRYSGKAVQRAHTQLARRRKNWPTFNLPESRGALTVDDVLNVPPGVERDAMIRKWCASVWDAYRDNHERVAALIQSELR